MPSFDLAAVQRAAEALFAPDAPHGISLALGIIHAGGTVVRRDLQPGETLLVDTGCVVAFTPNVNFEIQYVGKIKTALFGGEGLFFAKVTGPGTVWMQSLPFSRLASRIFAAAPQNGST